MPGEAPVPDEAALEEALVQVTQVIRHGDRHSILHRVDGGRTVVLTDCTGHVVDHFDAQGRLIGTQRLAANCSHAELVEQVHERLAYRV